jgi:hypothetical protein
MDAIQDPPRIALGKKMIRGVVTGQLRERLEGLRRGYPLLSFGALWQKLTVQEADLFAHAKRIEENDWGAKEN